MCIFKSDQPKITQLNLFIFKVYTLSSTLTYSLEIRYKKKAYSTAMYHDKRMNAI